LLIASLSLTLRTGRFKLDIEMGSHRKGADNIIACTCRGNPRPQGLDFIVFPPASRPKTCRHKQPRPLSCPPERVGENQKSGPRAERPRWTGPHSCRAKLGRRGILTQDRTRPARGAEGTAGGEPVIWDPQMPRRRRYETDPLGPFLCAGWAGLDGRSVDWWRYRCRGGKAHVDDEGGDVCDAIMWSVGSNFGTARGGCGPGMAARASVAAAADAPRSSSWR
jgi:hypothetical protein